MVGRGRSVGGGGGPRWPGAGRLSVVVLRGRVGPVLSDQSASGRAGWVVVCMVLTRFRSWWSGWVPVRFVVEAWL